jgi:hypothetical protein
MKNYHLNTLLTIKIIVEAPEIDELSVSMAVYHMNFVEVQLIIVRCSVMANRCSVMANK